MIKYIIIALCILVVLVLAESRREIRNFKTTRYEIKPSGLEELQQDKRYIVLADLHNHSFGYKNERLIAAIHKEKPDAVIIAGDMIVARPGHDTSAAEELIRALAAHYPIYYGNGNHEYRLKVYRDVYGDVYDTYREMLREQNVCYLENAFIELKEGQACIRIYGLDLDRSYYKRMKKQRLAQSYLNKTLGSAGASACNILIAHNPVYFPAYREWGADVTISGHIHGGIVRLPLLGGVISPQVDLFPKYSGGCYEEEGKYLILSRGLGTHTIKFRLFNQSELIVLSLKAGKALENKVDS